MILTKRGYRLFQKQNLNNVLQKQFSIGAVDIQKLDFQKFFTVKMEKLNDEFLFEFPNLEKQGEKPVQIMTEPCELDHLLSGIKENLNFIGKVNALTLDKKEISKQTQLDDLEGDNFYLIDSRNRIYLVENNDKEFSDSYQNVTSYCDKIELSFLERKVINNYLRRFDDINQQNQGGKIFSDQGQQQKEKTYNKKDIIQNLISALPNSKNIQTENEQQLFEQYVQLHQSIQYMKQQKNVLLEIAHKQEKRKMILGLAALVGQFCFVGVGTYSIWSWDIVEPMAYFTQFIGGVFCSVQFFKFQSDYDNTTFLEWRKQQALKRLAKKSNFDLEKLDLLEEEFAQLEKKIKANVLINL